MSASFTQTSSASQSSAAMAVYTLSLLILLGVISVIDAGVLAALLTPIKADLHFSDEQFGRLTAIFRFVGILAIPVFGVLASRLSRKALLILGLALWGAASVGSAWAGGFAALATWRAIVAFGESSYNTLVPSWLADAYGPKWRNFVFTLFMLRNKVGGALALLLGGWLAARYDWHTAFFVTGIPGLLLLVGLFWVREPAPGAADGLARSAGPVSFRESLAVLRHPGFVLHTIALTFHYTGMAIHFWMTPYLHRVFGLTNLAASSWLGSTIIYTLPAGLLGGIGTGVFLLHRHKGGLAALMTLTEFVTTVCFFVTFWSRDLDVVKWNFVLGSCAFGFSAGGMTTLIVETVPAALRVGATTISTIITGIFSGVIASELIGVASDRYGLDRAVYLAPAAYLGAMIFWGALAYRQRRPAAVESEAPLVPGDPVSA